MGSPYLPSGKSGIKIKIRMEDSHAVSLIYCVGLFR